MNRAIFLTVAVLLSLLPGISAQAQISARQGSTPQPKIESKSFDSPMVLELPVPTLGEIELGKEIAFPLEVRKFLCDQHVSFSSLSLGKSYFDRREKRLQLTLSGYLTVRESYDRRADVTIQLVQGGKRLATGTTRNINAEEGRTSRFKVVAMIPEATLEEAFAAEPKPTLEITLVVRDNS
jgi:hypothetical protein